MVLSWLGGTADEQDAVVATGAIRRNIGTVAT